MKEKKKILIPLAAGLLLLGILGGILLYRKMAPNKEHMPLERYFQAKQGEITLIVGDEISESKGIYQDNQLYLDLDLVKEKFNDRFYWDRKENLLLYAMPNAVLRTEPGSKDYLENNSRTTLEYEIVKVDGDKVYVAADYVKRHTALEYKMEKAPVRAVITYEFGGIEKEYAKTDSECKLRVKGSIKSEILVDLKEDAVLRVLERKNEDTGFCRVMEPSGVIGYVKAKDMGKIYKESKKTDFQEAEYSHILRKEKISLVWHQVTNQAANGRLLELLDKTKGVNVVCPTWFATSDNRGAIDSLASDNYVSQAHRAGVEVWGLCNDFSPNMKIGKVLESTSRRQKLAKNLIAEAIRYSLDGINIDFENVKKDSGEDFVQFIRELGVLCRNNGIVLSVDNYPPMEYNKYYNREEQANVADYVITMAYDEFYSGSEEAGPVSSLGYVQTATKKIIEEEAVPAKQAIIALPFYSRHWMERTSKGGAKLSSEACSMEYAEELVQESGSGKNWDEETQMNYISWTAAKTLHKLWIEDGASLELKLKAASDADVAGVAFWKLGLEKQDIWDTIIKYTK